MTSADFSRQALLRNSECPTTCRIYRVRETSPVKSIFFPSYLRMIYLCKFRITIGLCLPLQTYHTCTGLISCFCTSEQMFAEDFLQIPRRHGHPCRWLEPSRYQGGLGTCTR